MGDSADQASDSLDQIASSTKAEALSSAADGIASLGDAMIGVVEDSKEYLSIMGQLEASSRKTRNTRRRRARNRLYARAIRRTIGDTQTAATATANLQALGFVTGGSYADNGTGNWSLGTIRRLDTELIH